MFGKSLFSLAKWAIAAAIALMVGLQLLTAVAGIVIVLRTGNLTPLIGAAVLSVILLRITNSYQGTWKVAEILLPILSGISSIFLLMIVFLWLIPLGILASIIATGMILLILGAVHNPSAIQENLTKALDVPTSMLTGSPFAKPDHSRSFLRNIERQGMKVLVIPGNNWEKVIDLLKNRPQLPVVLVHFQEEDILIVRTGNDSSWMRRTRTLLKESGITGIKDASPLYTRVVLALPILEMNRSNDTGFEQYRIVTDENTVDIVLKQRPLQMTVFPTIEGLKLLVKVDDVFGLNVEDIPNPQIAQIVLERNISCFAIPKIIGGNEITT